jgi:NAD(P)-dependent dehydrogenase (short-subunit alcohol dehydrogenase family)
MEPTPKAIADCTRVLEALLEQPHCLAELDIEARNRLMTAAGRLSRPDRTERRVQARAVHQHRKASRRAADESQLAATGIRQKRLAPVFVTPDPAALPEAGGGIFEAAAPTSAGAPGDAVQPPPLNTPRTCYVCKVRCDRPHFFYDQMCSGCGDFNYGKRSQTANLSGRTALISGARVKIGYQAAIMLLRAGARVIVSTRFPHDAALRYARERDFEAWRDRLHIYGLDLRHTPSVEAFARHLQQELTQLDFILHNACQTVRRPVGFYRHLMEGELGQGEHIPDGARVLLRGYDELRAQSKASSKDGRALPSGLLAAPALSQLALSTEDLESGQQLFPMGRLDADLQQVDLREKNSWRLSLDQVSSVELLEVQLVNAIAPFVLNAKLRPLMQRQRTFDKHIVNVSAMEGQFYRRFKTDKHPHTNMAKAALNMMTRTSAPDYAKDGIFMNSVDTGWVTDEDPAHIAERKTLETGFHPPLDIVDGAARIVDPIFDGINTGRHVWGQFLKDYRPTAW